MSESKLEGLLIRIAFGAIIGTVYAGFVSVLEPRLTEGVISVIGGFVCVCLGLVTIWVLDLVFNRFISDKKAGRNP